MSAATIDQVRALLACKLRREDERFWAIAQEIVARLAKSGSPHVHEFSALVQRGLVASQVPQQMQLLDLPRHGADPLSFEKPSQARDTLLLSDLSAAQIDTFVAEQVHAEKLRAAGFEPSCRLLLVGPPGTGKTMTARVIATALDLPLGILQIHSVVDSYMGETSKQLAKVFGRIAQTKAVYLFDEIDAVASQRNQTKNSADTEARRIVNSMLMMLDADRSDSILIGATNLPEHLDHALARRFDTMIAYEHPSAAHAQIMMKRLLERVQQGRVDWTKIGHLATQLSHSDVETIAMSVGRHSVLHDEPITTARIVDAIRNRASNTPRRARGDD